jgi:hypothetical protein
MGMFLYRSGPVQTCTKSIRLLIRLGSDRSIDELQKSHLAFFFFFFFIVTLIKRHYNVKDVVAKEKGVPSIFAGHILLVWVVIVYSGTDHF